MERIFSTLSKLLCRKQKKPDIDISIFFVDLSCLEQEIDLEDLLRLQIQQYKAQKERDYLEGTNGD